MERQVVGIRGYSEEEAAHEGLEESLGGLDGRLGETRVAMAKRDGLQAQMAALHGRLVALELRAQESARRLAQRCEELPERVAEVIERGLADGDDGEARARVALRLALDASIVQQRLAGIELAQLECAACELDEIEENARALTLRRDGLLRESSQGLAARLGELDREEARLLRRVLAGERGGEALLQASIGLGSLMDTLARAQGWSRQVAGKADELEVVRAQVSRVQRLLDDGASVAQGLELSRSELAAMTGQSGAGRFTEGFFASLVGDWRTRDDVLQATAWTAKAATAAATARTTLMSGVRELEALLTPVRAERERLLETV